VGQLLVPQREPVPDEHLDRRIGDHVGVSPLPPTDHGPGERGDRRIDRRVTDDGAVRLQQVHRGHATA
jgi:hypothetical protein